MEPALDERGDAAVLGKGALLEILPQWSPLSTSGATKRRCQQDLMGLVPQWSPLSTSGAT